MDRGNSRKLGTDEGDVRRLRGVDALFLPNLSGIVSTSNAGIVVWYIARKMFLSSLAPRGGRYSASPVPRTQLACFYPRSPRGAGATQSWEQSYIIPDGVSILAHPEGRALRSDRIRQGRDGSVSILAHPEGRALPVATFSIAVGSQWFQSSPTPRGGRYKLQILNEQRGTKVSILAHPEGRALHTQYNALHLDDNVSILAHPEGRALPTC